MKFVTYVLLLRFFGGNMYISTKYLFDTTSKASLRASNT